VKVRLARFPQVARRIGDAIEESGSAWEFFGRGKGANTDGVVRVYAGMNTTREKGILCAILLGLLTAVAGCVSTGAGTTTIDPPAPPGLPNPPPVTVPTPGTR
jgi:hypothetical protein